jgi:hypothetical protein
VVHLSPHLHRNELANVDEVGHIHHSRHQGADPELEEVLLGGEAGIIRLTCAHKRGTPNEQRPERKKVTLHTYRGYTRHILWYCRGLCYLENFKCAHMLELVWSCVQHRKLHTCGTHDQQSAALETGRMQFIVLVPNL